MRQAADPVVIASRWVDRGALTAADLLLHQAMEDSSTAPAANLLGRIAMAVGEPGLAAERFRSATEIDPYFKPASKNLREAESKVSEPPKEGSDAWRRELRRAGQSAGYLVIRSWGAGFWADVDHVIGNLLAAEITGRVPVIHWGSTSRWKTPGVSNAWDSYFEPVSAVGLEKAVAAGRIYPGKWAADTIDGPDINRWQGPGSLLGGPALMNRPEEVVVADYVTCVAQMRHWLPIGHEWRGLDTAELYRALVARWVRPLPQIAVETNEFWRANVGEGPVVAVHIRASDKAQEIPQLPRLLAQYPAHVDAAIAAAPSSRIYLLTDATDIVESYRQRYGSRLITAECQRTSTPTGVHFLPGVADRYRLAVEVMRDAYIAARCGRFIGLGYSNVSCMIRHLRAWPAGACTLLGPDLHLRPPVALYAPES